MFKVLLTAIKIQILCILIMTLNISQASAVSCHSFLSVNQPHPVSLFYGGAGPTYRSALKRFNIHQALEGHHQNLSPREKVSAYFEEIDRTYSKALTDNSLKQTLKDEWLERALITAVPDSYISFEKRRAREEGHGDIVLTEEALDTALKALREAQEASFTRWFDYIMGEDITVPAWLRYILLEDLLKLGIYNEDKQTFSIRNNETAGPYPELNSEAFGKVYASLESFYLNNSENIEAADLELIQKDLSRSFANIYGRYIHNYSQTNRDFDPEVTEGKWVKYNQGNETEAESLFDSLQEKNTGWCTAASCATAQEQVNGGDFYVYYSRDFNGEYTIPRIAIRMQGSQIAEIRGRAQEQNLDPHILLTNILQEKLEDFGSEGEKYYKKVEDMKRLTIIDNKNQSGLELSREDLHFLYEMDENIEGFGYERDPRIEELLNGRDARVDISFILNIRPDQVSFTKKEALSGGIIYHHGDLSLSNRRNPKGLVLPRHIRGNLNLYGLTTAEGLVLPESVGGNLNLYGLTSAEGLVLPKSIGGDLELSGLTNARGLVLPKSVGGSLGLKGLTSAKGLVFPESVRGDLHLYGLTSAEGLVLPKSIGGDLHLHGLKSAEGLVLPKSVGGDLSLTSLTSAEGLVFPESVGGSLHLSSLTSAEGLVLPKSVGGRLFLNALKSAEGLILPEYLGGDYLGPS